MSGLGARQLWRAMSPAAAILTIALTAVGAGHLFSFQQPQGSANDPRSWRVEFLADFNIPTGAKFEEIGNLRGAFAPPFGGSPAAQLSREELLRRKQEGGFGGISGLAWDLAGQTLYAISDASVPVIFTFQVHLEKRKLRLEPQRAFAVSDSSGTPVPAWTLDAEGVELAPWGGLLISSEGYSARNPPVEPALLETDFEGRIRRRLPLPQHYLWRGHGQQQSGVRHNLGFEGLAVSPDGESVFLAAEGPLVQDGPPCGIESGCFVRILQYRVEGSTAVPAHEFVYPVGRMKLPRNFEEARGAMGLSAAAALNSRELLVLERGFAIVGETGKSHTSVHLYQVDLTGATDVLKLESLAGARFQPARKRLLLDLEQIVARFSPGYRTLDNYEAFCLGPESPDGSRVLLLASDNNFQEAQRTSFVALRLIPGETAQRRR